MSAQRKEKESVWAWGMFGFHAGVFINRGTPIYHPLILDFPWNIPSSYWDTPIYHPLILDFPWNKPSSYWDTPIYHPLILDFPWNKPSSYWGTPIYGNLHVTRTPTATGSKDEQISKALASRNGASGCGAWKYNGDGRTIRETSWTNELWWWFLTIVIYI